MTRQWGRYLQLKVEGSGGNIDLSLMRVRFQIKDSTAQSPRVAEIRISNLSERTAKKLQQQGKKVEIIAGYTDGYGRIFQGDIKQVRIGRENPTDTYVDIFAATGERAYNNAIVNKTLKAGSNGRDVYKALVEPMKAFGLGEGDVPQSLEKLVYKTPVVLYGMARDHLRSLAHSVGATWNIRDDKVDVTEKDGARPGGAVVLNSRTGLVGLPTQTELGIVARCLINTRIGINSLVKIDQKSIQTMSPNLSYGGEAMNSEPYRPSLSPDGIYRVIAIDHLADTHGQPWYCELYCMARGGTIPGAQAPLGRGGADGRFIAPDKAYIGQN